MEDFKMKFEDGTIVDAKIPFKFVDTVKYNFFLGNDGDFMEVENGWLWIYPASEDEDPIGFTTNAEHDKKVQARINRQHWTDVTWSGVPSSIFKMHEWGEYLHSIGLFAEPCCEEEKEEGE